MVKPAFIITVIYLPVLVHFQSFYRAFYQKIIEKNRRGVKEEKKTTSKSTIIIETNAH